jgi:hypothetical protein
MCLLVYNAENVNFAHCTVKEFLLSPQILFWPGKSLLHDRRFDVVYDGVLLACILASYKLRKFKQRVMAEGFTME